MLNGVKPKISSGDEFAPIPIDKYTVLCVDVTLVKSKKFIGVGEEDVLNYKFQILDDKPIPTKEGEDSQTTRGRFVWHKCRLASAENSWLSRLIKAVVGRDVTTEEVESYDVESIVGRQVNIVITQKKSKTSSKIYNNITDFFTTTVPLVPLEGSPEAGKRTVVEKTSVPVNAPTDEAEQFIDTMKQEGGQAQAAAVTTPVVSDPPTPAEPSEEEVLRQKLAAIEAKKKADAALAK